MQFQRILIMAILFLSLAGPVVAQDAYVSGQSGSGTSTQTGTTGAWSATNGAVASQSQQNQQSQGQSQLAIFNNMPGSANVSVYNGPASGGASVATQATGTPSTTTNNSTGPSVNIANNSPPLVLQNESPSVVISYPDQPTFYPGFAINPPADLPFMRHYDVNRAWNTCPSLFDMSLHWDYSQVGTYDKHVKVDGKDFGRGEGGYSNIRVFVSKDDAAKAASPGTNVRYLFAGASHGDEEGVSILDCEMAALSKAKELGANGVVVKIEGFTVASKTKGKSFGVGASGTWLERFGNLAMGLPVNFAYATALGDGYAKPFVCFYIVEVK